MGIICLCAVGALNASSKGEQVRCFEAKSLHYQKWPNIACHHHQYVLPPRPPPRPPPPVLPLRPPPRSPPPEVSEWKDEVRRVQKARNYLGDYEGGATSEEEDESDDE